MDACGPVAVTETMCPRYQRAIDIIGKRWTGLILRVLLDGPQRFGHLVHAIEGLSERMLSERLKELEARGLVERRVVPGAPVRIEYALTEKGRDLQEAIAAIQRWAERWDGIEADVDAETTACCGGAVASAVAARAEPVAPSGTSPAALS